MEILALIPARSGSKSIKDKNIRFFKNIPLIAHSIITSKETKLITRIIVSTDSEKYAKIAQDYGAEVPFLRPKSISNDKSTDIELFQHALMWLKKHENYTPDVCVHLRPTHPIRDPKDIDAMIEMLLKDDSVDSVRSISIENKTPYKMWQMNEYNELKPVASCNIPEAYNMPRQILPTVYSQNGSIDVIRTTTITEKKSMTGDIIKGYVTPINCDIDTEPDFIKAERFSELLDMKNGSKKIFCFDIDGVIATKVRDNNYKESTPIKPTIEIINRLYDMGHTIILNTARGFKTGIDWTEYTKKQLSSWGVKYSVIYFNKPNADFYIDDKLIELEDIINEGVN